MAAAVVGGVVVEDRGLCAVLPPIERYHWPPPMSRIRTCWLIRVGGDGWRRRSERNGVSMKCAG